jgi:hypothetical protein
MVMVVFDAGWYPWVVYSEVVVNGNLLVEEVTRLLEVI